MAERRTEAERQIHMAMYRRALGEISVEDATVFWPSCRRAYRTSPLLPLPSKANGTRQ